MMSSKFFRFEEMFSVLHSWEEIKSKIMVSVCLYQKKCSKLPHFIEKHGDISLKELIKKEHASISTVIW